MSIVKSISGIRGTIGGSIQEGLNPVNIVQFTCGYALLTRKESKHHNRPLIVVGRDARISGEMVKNIVVGTLQSMGCDIIDIGLATTPTTEMAVIESEADGGIIITASHNPKNWNALKLLTRKGEFLSASQGAEVLQLASQGNISFVPVEEMGIVKESDFLSKHIKAILELEEVDIDAIKAANFTVSYDAINSVGAIALPPLLKALGVQQVHAINDIPNGNFAHNPEPLPLHLTDLCNTVRKTQSHVGFSVDPDVDRLAIIDEKGNFFGEEYTLVAVADYLLSYHGGGNTVSNMSSTRALRDVTEQHGGLYTSAAVGEVNVVTAIHQTNALIGGEGNGGVIFPKLHSGRDALLGIALFLTHLAKSKVSTSQLRTRYPNYEMCKERIELNPQVDTSNLFDQLKEKVAALNPNTIDGVKIDFVDSWVQIRSSNTEPIVRIYTEAPTQQQAQELASEYKNIVQQLVNNQR